MKLNRMQLRRLIENTVINQKVSQVERKIHLFTNMDLSKSNIVQDKSQPKALYIPGIEMLLGYILSQVSNFLLEKTIADIHNQIYKKGVLFGTRLLAFEIFNYFFTDEKRLETARKITPTFLSFFEKHANIIPSISIRNVTNPTIVIENIKTEIMNSDTPFKVNVDAIIMSHMSQTF